MPDFSPARTWRIFYLPPVLGRAFPQAKVQRFLRTCKKGNLAASFHAECGHGLFSLLYCTRKEMTL